MVQRYVWWDDIHKQERIRCEFRLPKPLQGMLREVCNKHEISMTALVVGILSYAMDADRRQRLRVEVVPNVRVTEAGPADKPVDVPVPDAKVFPRRRYGIPRVR